MPGTLTFQILPVPSSRSGVGVRVKFGGSPGQSFISSGFVGDAGWVDGAARIAGQERRPRNHTETAAEEKYFMGIAVSSGIVDWAID
jgi:hypothetical protein